MLGLFLQAVGAVPFEGGSQEGLFKLVMAVKSSS
jgi:hypothetical protein